LRILLDSKDLIDLIERDKPASLAEIDRILRAGGHQLVLSYVNVTELVAPLRKGVEFVDLRTILLKAESLPVCYIRESMIPGDELRAAVSAFERNATPRSINPYVRRWDEVITPFGESAMRPIVGLRLWEIVKTLWGQRALPNFSQQADLLRRQFDTERILLQSQTASMKPLFTAAVERHLDTYRVTPPTSGGRAFGEFLYDNPIWCPSNRIAFDLYYALLRNTNDVPEDGDILDMNHLKTVPYVDALTLDRRMNSYLEQVLRRLEIAGLDFKDRVFRNFADVLDLLESNSFNADSSKAVSDQ
jgi:hypothetical protein